LVPRLQKPLPRQIPLLVNLKPVQLLRNRFTDKFRPMRTLLNTVSARRLHQIAVQPHYYPYPSHGSLLLEMSGSRPQLVRVKLGLVYYLGDRLGLLGPLHRSSFLFASSLSGQ